MSGYLPDGVTQDMIDRELDGPYEDEEAPGRVSGRYSAAEWREIERLRDEETEHE